MIPVKKYLISFKELFYPQLCLICNEHALSKNRQFCLECEGGLPETDFHFDTENQMLEKFAGRVKIEMAAACFFFIKTGRIQQLMHALKYQSKPKIGIQIGAYYGNLLKQSLYFQSIDLIIPVPLHPRKEKLRGYNQSDAFAQGLANSMNIPWLKNGLIRTEFTETQTKKTVIERFDNVAEALAVNRSSSLINKHILLIDDVMTTGATLEACTVKLLQIENVKVSIVTIAFAI